jgi:predicted aspartyl protease
MELTGRMDEMGRVWLPIAVRGNRAETALEAMVDLGFTGAVILPVEIAAPLGVELNGFSIMSPTEESRFSSPSSPLPPLATWKFLLTSS